MKLPTQTPANKQLRLEYPYVTGACMAYPLSIFRLAQFNLNLLVCSVYNVIGQGVFQIYAMKSTSVLYRYSCTQQHAIYVIRIV